MPKLQATLLLSQFTAQTSASDTFTAADVLARHKHSIETLEAMTKTVEAAGPLELPLLLTAFDQTTDPKIGAALLDALTKSKALAALRPDALRAHLKQFPKEIQAKAEPLYAKLNPDAAQQKARLDELVAKLPEGDVRRGMQVFHSAKSACASCHTIGYVGGKLGPDLTKIGAIRQQRDLLESIVYPSASFVQSYEPTIVETADGDTLSGILRKNDDEGLLLLTGPDQETRIARKEVKEIRPGSLSVMPAGLDQILTAQELADLVAFLRDCK